MELKSRSRATRASSGPRGLPIVYRPGALFSAHDDTPTAARPAKASETAAAAIVGDIVAGGLAVGDRLPPESDMIVRYAVSRETLREALRLLEVQGVITLKRGPGGGPLVGALNAAYLARTATMYFHTSGATYDEVFADLTNFRAVIADLSGNHVLTLLSQAVTHVVESHVLDLDDPVAAGAELAHSHTDIARAIISGHATKAAGLMEAPIHEVTQAHRVHFSERMKEPIAWM